MPELRFPAAGVVTDSKCGTGTKITSGSAPIAIDGTPVLALATRTPLWRDLTVGARGPDAEALNVALSALGKKVSGDVVTADSLSAFNAVSSAVGAPTQTSVLPRSSILWLPAASVTVAECTAPLGSAAVQGNTLAKLSPPVSGATLADVSTDLAQGERVFVVQGQRLPLKGSSASPEALAWLTSHPEVGTTVDGAQTVTGTSELASPLEVVSVPAAALIVSSDPKRGCVFSRDGRHGVVIVGSMLGSAFVTSEDPLSDVLLDPKTPGSCS